MRSPNHSMCVEEEKAELPYPSPAYTVAEFSRGWTSYQEDERYLSIPTPFTTSPSEPISPLTPALSVSGGFRTPVMGSPVRLCAQSDFQGHDFTQFGPWTSHGPSSYDNDLPFSGLSQMDTSIYCSYRYDFSDDRPLAGLPLNEDPSSIYSPGFLSNPMDAKPAAIIANASSEFEHSPRDFHEVDTLGQTMVEGSSGDHVKMEDASSEYSFDGKLSPGSESEFEFSSGYEHENADDEKTYACHYPGCDWRFTRSNNLKSHLLTHNPHRVKLHKCHEPGCHYAGEGFGRYTDLARHIKAVHMGIRPYHCPHCSQTFSRRDGLLRHTNKGCKHMPRQPRVQKRQGRLSRPASRRTNSIGNVGTSRGRSERETKSLDVYLSNDYALRLAGLEDRHDAKRLAALQDAFAEQHDERFCTSPAVKMEE